MVNSDLYKQKMVDAIETMFGPYTRKPKMVLTPNLYRTYGAWGQTTYLKESHLPILIEIDQDVYSSAEGMATVIHELLEWRGIENAEPFPHQFAEQNESAILSVAALTPLDFFLSKRPLLSLLIRGY